MKKYSFFFLLACIAFVFISCSKKEDEQYYSVLGTYVKSNDSTYIITDEDNRLLIRNPGEIPTTIVPNDRVIAYIIIKDETLPQGVDYIVELFGIAEVLYKDVVPFDTTAADSIGEDPMYVRNVWVAKNYLNVNFDYYGNTQIHLINCVRMPNDPPNDGIVELELRHNDNNDSYGYLVNGFVTFNLTSIQDQTRDSVVIHIKAKEYNNAQYEHSFTYKY